MHQLVAVVRWSGFTPGLTSGEIVAIEQFSKSSTLGECLFPEGEVFPFLL